MPRAKKIASEVSEAAPIDERLFHALDKAPINSKIVVTFHDGAVLATPDGITRLEKTDPANKLPSGAKIQKMSEGNFWSVQLSPSEDHPSKTYPTASEAIENFVSDFHPRGLHG